MTIRQLLHNATLQLAQVAENPRLEAEILFVHAIQKHRSDLYKFKETELEVSDTQSELFAHCLQRRCNNEPIAYIIGKREFWSLELNVDRNTLIPRPETELLVELILQRFAESEHVKLADLGTGSGAIALALAKEKPSWHIYATDINENALQVAKKNAQQLALDKIIFKRGNWCEALPSLNTKESFDVIVSNPPYISEKEWDEYAAGLAYEPRAALISGKDGLDAIRQIIQTAKSYLKEKGYLMIEHGFAQSLAVKEIFKAYGYSDVVSYGDLAGHDRVTLGQYSM